MAIIGPIYDIKSQGISYSTPKHKRLERSSNASLHYTGPQYINTKKKL